MPLRSQANSLSMKKSWLDWKRRKCYLVEPEVPGGSRAGVPVQVRRCDRQHLELVHPGAPDKFLPSLYDHDTQGYILCIMAAKERMKNYEAKEGREKEENCINTG